MSEVPKIPIPSIVRERLRAVAASGPHPDANLLSAFAENTLPVADRAKVMDHLATCADCRNIITFAMPQIEEAAVSARSRSTGFRLRWATARWSALAAAAAVLVAVVIIYQVQPVPESNMNLAAERKAATVPQPKTPPAENGLAQTTTATTDNEKQRKDIQREKELASNTISANTRGFGRQAGVAGKALDENGVTADLEASKDQKLGASTSTGAKGIAPQQSQAGMIAGGAMAAPVQIASAKEAAKSDAGTNSAAVANAFSISPRDSFKPSSLTASNANLASSNRAPAPSVSAPQLASKARGAQPQPAPAPPEAYGYGNSFAKKTETAPSSTSETVEVTGQSPQVQSRAYVTQLQLHESGKLAVPTASLPVLAKWRVHKGRVQQSFDNGVSWNDVKIAKAVAFRQVAAAGSQVWAGGSNAVLYHSSDNGQTWSPLWSYARDASAKAGYRYPKAPASITEIIFSGERYGQMRVKVRGKDPQEFFFTTSDGGQTWHEETID